MHHLYPIKQIPILILTILLLLTSLTATPPTYNKVTKLYIASFNRAPDSAGIKYWLNDSTLDMEGIASSFFEQDEMKEKYPKEYSHRDFIGAIYLNLFKRTPDSGGADYWNKELENYSISRSLFILAVINGALDADRDILEYKTRVGIAYANDGRDGLDDALAMMQEITTDEKSVDAVLCKYKLLGCSVKKEIAKEKIVENSTYIGGGSSSNGGGATVIPSTTTPTIDTSNFKVNDFGTKYTSQIPLNATKQRYDEKLFALVKGEVVDADGSPLEGVEISLLNHSEYGSQLSSSSSGSYAIAVEGGVSMSVRYTKDGYSTVDLGCRKTPNPTNYPFLKNR